MKELEGSAIADVWAVFCELCKIPRGSGNEKAVSDFAVNFARERGWGAKQDAVNNVLITVPPTVGYEKSKPVILQAHLDMVNEKDGDCKHDFSRDPLDLYVKDGFLRARGTTLGADNGIGVAMALAFAGDKTKPHPPLEIVLTVEEETTFRGAKSFDCSALKGRRLISLDNTREDEIAVGCARLVGLTLTGDLNAKNNSPIETGAVVKISGLAGGHSGTDILKRRSAFDFTARVVNELVNMGARISKIDCGNAANAIARESEITVAIDHKKAEKILKNLENDFNQELKPEKIKITCAPKNLDFVLNDADTKRVRDLLMILPNGGQTILSYPDCAESSLNIGKTLIENGKILFNVTVRSSIESLEKRIIDKLRAVAATFALKMDIGVVSPNFILDERSEFLTLCRNVFRENYGREIKLVRFHAVVELGVFCDKIRGLETVMFAPNLYDIHSPAERLDIKSTEHMYDYFCKVLARAK